MTNQYEPPTPPIDKYNFATFAVGESRTYFQNVAAVRNAVHCYMKRSGKLFTSQRQSSGTKVWRLE